MKTTISKFNGIAPKFSPHLKEGYAVTAQNCDLKDGKIKPWDAHNLITDLRTITNIRSATYRWTLSGHGTNEYRCELAAGGNPSLVDPDSVLINSVAATEGTVGSLTAGKWDYGDNDTLGYSTVYVRLSDGTDPDGKASAYVQHIVFNTYNFMEYFNGAWLYGADRYYCPWKIGTLDLLFYLDAGVLKKSVAGTVANVGQALPGAPTLETLTVTKDLTDGVTYKWTAAGHGTNEFYCDLLAGGDPGLADPDELRLDGTVAVKKALAALTAGSWGYGDHDALGYSTIYVRLSDGADPDTKNADYVQHVLTTGLQKDLLEGNSVVELVTNGAFGANIVGWTTLSSGSGLDTWDGTFFAMKLWMVGPSVGRGATSQSIVTVPNTVYALIFDASNTDLRYKIGTSQDGNQILALTQAISGTNRVTFTATTTTTYLYFEETQADSTVRLDNVSCLPIAVYEWYLSSHGTTEYRLTKLGTDIITNGTFDTALTGWTDLDIGTGDSHWDAGVMHLDGVTGRREQAITTIIGKIYRIVWTANAQNGLRIGTTSGGGEILPVTNHGAGTNTEFFTATTTTTYIGFSGTGTTPTIDNVSCKPLDDPELVEPDVLRINSLTAAKATIGSLTAGQWGYGNNDALTYNTIYVRIAGGTDPDLEACWYINYILYPELSGTYNYLYTVERTINGHMDESGPSAVSQEIVVVNEKIRVTIASATYPWNLYRISLASGEYQFVAQIAAGTTTYDDNLPDADLGDAPTTWYTSDLGNEIIFGPPPASLDGLINEPNAAMLFAWKGPTLYWTEPGYPDAWPAFYSMNFPGNIKRAIAIAGVVAVLTDIGPFRVDGTSPEALQQSKVLGKEPCMSIAACATPKGVTYLSDSGIVLFNLVDTTVLTDQNFGEAWFKTNVVAAGAHLVENDNILRLFHTAGTLVVDARSDPAIWYTLDTVAYASAVRDDQGEVYIITTTGIEQLHAHASTDMTWIWQSGDILLKTEKEKEWGEIEVIGSGTVTVTIYVDDVSKGSKSLTFTTERGRTLKAPEHTLGKALQFLLTGTGQVNEVIVRAGDF